ncbi:ABC transporter ATP-binding protein [Verticiella sediminum]|nr:ABC transporter ATP-binding protein [Verticiella sediminum]
MTAPLLEILDYSGAFRAVNGELKPVLHEVGYRIMPGTITAVVGETGSGKSLTALSILGLLPATFVRLSGEIRFKGRNILDLDASASRRLRGEQISMVFQDARAALNPVFTIGRQLADTHQLHHGGSRRAAMAQAVEALRRVHIPEPERRARQYPHEFSGGMAQRAMIALAALICQPELLIMDEPTTGLDVTTQAEIMALIVDLARTRGLTVCLITHDLGVVVETCDAVVVMNAGRVVETGTTEQIFTAPREQYTRRLLAASQLGEEEAV